MSAAPVIASANPLTDSTSAPRLDRIAGISGLAFAVLVLIENLILGTMSPPRGDASTEKITTFYVENDTAVAAVLGLVPFAAVVLCIFLAGVYPRLSRTSTEAAFWTRLGAIGVVILAVGFLIGISFEYVLIANAEEFVAEGTLAKTLVQFRDATLVISGLGIGITMLGLGRAARLGAVIPAWQEALGLIAALGFFISAVAAVPSVDGSPIGLLGFAAFMLWLLWLALTGIRLLRVESEPV